MKKSASAHLKLVVILSLMSALSILLGKYLAFNVGGMLRFSLENLPIVFSGLAFGPLAGAAVGLISDLVGCFLVGYEINPLVTLGAAVIGLVSGFVRMMIPKELSKPWLVVSLTELSAHLIGSVIIKTIGLSAYYSTPFFILMLWRLLNYLIIGVLEGAVVYAILKNPTIKKEINSIRK